MTAARPRLSPFLVLCAACALLATAASAQTTYRVTLKNGNEFLSKYRPAEASYDSSKMLLMTELSNVIAISKDDISEVITESEARGFGRRLNETTVVVGNSANDAPTQEQLQEMQAGFDALFPGLPYGLRSGMPQEVQAPIFSEPSQVGRGIPVGFVTGAQPTLGNFPVVTQPPPG